MAEPNPYEPPTHDRDPSDSEPPHPDGPPGYKLYTPGQVTLATVLGTPVAAFYLLSLNRRRLGRDVSATNTLLAGFAITAGAMVLGWLLPEAITRALPVAVAVSVSQYARADRPILDDHRARGGRTESWLKAAGVGLLGLAALALVVVVLVMLIGDL